MSLEFIINNIKKLGFDIDDFNNMLMETDSYLTGSIITKSVIDLDYPDNYMVLYVKGNKLNPIYDEYLVERYGFLRRIKCDFKKNSYTDDDICNKIIPLPELYLEEIINYIYEYTSDELKKVIYIVYTKKNINIIEDLIKIIDLKCCQIYYYDNMIYESYDNNIDNLNNYKTEITSFFYDKYYMNDIINFLKRVIDYSKLGIYTIWDENSKSNIGIKFLENEDIIEKEWYFREWNNLLENAYIEGLNIDPNLYLDWNGVLSNKRGTIALNTDKKFINNVKTLVKNDIKKHMKLEDNFITEGYDIDEDNLPNKCVDSYIMEPENFINFVDYISNLGDIIIVAPGKTIDTSTIYCYTDEDIYKILTEKLDGFFYECENENTVNYDNIYVKVYANSGFLVLVELDNIRKMIKSTEKYRLFYLVPKLDENNDPIKINYTMSYRNAMTSYEDYTSSKHCQEGSSFYLYEYRVCNGNSCNITKSLIKKPFNYNNFILTHSYDLNLDEIDLIKREYQERENEYILESTNSINE